LAHFWSSKVTFTGVKLVDSTFSAPEATGCGVFSAYVENSAVLEGDLSAGEASEVRTFAMP
jgi:hypothetical protein